MGPAHNTYKIVTIYAYNMITELDDESLKKYSYVMVSSYRTKTMKTLKDEVMTPTEIAKESGIRSNHMSKVLQELKRAEMVECINEEFKRGRLYRLTETGDKIVDYLE